MDYDAILKKMNLYYFEGKLQTEMTEPVQPLTKEEYIQLRKRQWNEKKRIQYEQSQKRKLYNINTSSQVQMNISKFG